MTSIDGLEPIPSLWARGRVHSSISQGHTETNNHSHTFIPREDLETPINLTCILLDGGNTWEEHANYTQTGPSWELNLEPSSCEATILTTTPPCSPKGIPVLKRILQEAAVPQQSRSKNVFWVNTIMQPRHSSSAKLLVWTQPSSPERAGAVEYADRSALSVNKLILKHPYHFIFQSITYSFNNA